MPVLFLYFLYLLMCPLRRTQEYFTYTEATGITGGELGEGVISEERYVVSWHTFLLAAGVETSLCWA